MCTCISTVITHTHTHSLSPSGNAYRNEETQCLATTGLGSTQYISLGQSKRNTLSLNLGHLLKVGLGKALLCSVREWQVRKELDIAVVFLDHKFGYNVNLLDMSVLTYRMAGFGFQCSNVVLLLLSLGFLGADLLYCLGLFGHDNVWLYQFVEKGRKKRKNCLIIE